MEKTKEQNKKAAVTLPEFDVIFRKFLAEYKAKYADLPRETHCKMFYEALKEVASGG